MRFNMKRFLIGVLFGGLLMGLQTAQAAEGVVYLDALAQPENWRVTGTILSTSETLQADGRPTLHFQVPIQTDDEALAGVTWPKFWRAVQSDMGADWSEYDRFEFLILGDFTPANVVPPKAIAFQMLAPDAKQGASQSITFDRLGVWQRVSVPIDSLKNLDQLKAMQLYFAKRRFRGIEQADFYLGGFRLVRDDAAGAHTPVLLTPEASLAKPELALERASVDASLRFYVQADADRYSVAVDMTDADQPATIDLSSFALPPGRHELIATLDREPIHIMPFEWLPFALVDVDPGDMMIGTNQGRVVLASTSPTEQPITLTMQAGERTIASERVVMSAQSEETIAVSWPLRDATQEALLLRAHWGSILIGEVAIPVEDVAVFGSLPAHQAVRAQNNKPTTFRVPVQLASGSHDSATLQWRLCDASGEAKDAGETSLQGTSAIIATKLNEGRYTLALTLTWDNEYSTQVETTVWFVQPL